MLAYQYNFLTVKVLPADVQLLIWMYSRKIFTMPKFCKNKAHLKLFITTYSLTVGIINGIATSLGFGNCVAQVQTATMF